jgi:hypothetical protein
LSIDSYDWSSERIRMMFRRASWPLPKAWAGRVTDAVAMSASSGDFA